MRDGHVFDMPQQTRQRYQIARVRARFGIWCLNNKPRWLEQGKDLRIALPEPALVHWSSDGWRRSFDTPTRDTTLGLHVADLETAHLAIGTEIVFTIRWSHDERWDGADYRVLIIEGTPAR
jgi:glucoamylase